MLLSYANKIARLVPEAEGELGTSQGHVSGDLPLSFDNDCTIRSPTATPSLSGRASTRPVLPSQRQCSQVVQCLLDGEVPIGLIEGPSRERGVHVEPFMDDELVLIASTNFESNHLSGSKFVSVSLLLRERGSGSRRVVEKALERAGYKLKSFKKVMELDSTEAVKSAVEARLGVGFVSLWAISKELELGTLKSAKVDGVSIKRQFTLISRTGTKPAGPAGARSAHLPSAVPAFSRGSRENHLPTDKHA